jgi:hypothetical protein
MKPGDLVIDVLSPAPASLRMWSSLEMNDFSVGELKSDQTALIIAIEYIEHNGKRRDRAFILCPEGLGWVEIGHLRQA